MSTRKSTAFYGILLGFVCLVVGMVIASRLDLTPGSFAGPMNVPAANSAPLNGPIDATTFRNIAHDASPAVVSITVRLTRQVSGINEFFGFPMPFGNGPNDNGNNGQNGNPLRRGQRAPQQEQQVEGAGSGFIVDKAGYILTNNHVVEDAKSIEVHLATMADNEPGLSAKVVGRDPLSDVALIQLTDMPREPLQEAKFGDSDQMAPGDWVMAIGNPFRLSNTVTVGVVSAVGRETEASYRGRPQAMIQTDAAINHGNSGGPLLNIRGEVVGINTMIVSDSDEGGNLGVGFAVPINTVRDLLPQLRNGKVSRGRIGVNMVPNAITPDYAQSLGLPNSSGSEVKGIVPDSPAAEAGLKAGDVIVEFNGQAVKNNSDLSRLVTRTTPGTTVPVKIFRDRKPMTLNIKVAELDLEQEQQAFAGPNGQPRNETPDPTKETGLGMSIRNLTAAERQQLKLPSTSGGAVVTDVTPFGAASQAGISEGDVILSINNQVVHGAEETIKAIDAMPAGRTGRMIIWSGGQEQLVQVRKR